MHRNERDTILWCGPATGSCLRTSKIISLKKDVIDSSRRLANAIRDHNYFKAKNGKTWGQRQPSPLSKLIITFGSAWRTFWAKMQKRNQLVCDICPPVQSMPPNPHHPSRTTTTTTCIRFACVKPFPRLVISGKRHGPRRYFEMRCDAMQTNNYDLT